MSWLFYENCSALGISPWGKMTQEEVAALLGVTVRRVRQIHAAEDLKREVIDGRVVYDSFNVMMAYDYRKAVGRPRTRRFRLTAFHRMALDCTCEATEAAINRALCGRRDPDDPDWMEYSSRPYLQQIRWQTVGLHQRVRDARTLGDLASPFIIPHCEFLTLWARELMAFDFAAWKLRQAEDGMLFLMRHGLKEDVERHLHKYE